MSEQERTSEETDEAVREGEQPDVEGHRRSSNLNEEAATDDDSPDFEGHRKSSL